MESQEQIDSIITYVFLKKLLTPPVKTKAYKLGLINEAGHVIEEPKTDEEREALTVLDKTIWKIRRLLGNRITQLKAFLWLITRDENEFYNKMVVRGSVETRAEIKRIKKDVERVAESYECSVNDMLLSIIKEDLDGQV